MSTNLRGVRAVLCPGTGSDHRYVSRVFDVPLRAVGAELVAPPPCPESLIAGYIEAFDDAAAHGPIAVGGVSLGAAVAVAWALRNPGRAVAVLAALPAWTGAPDGATAALAAHHSAQQLRSLGLVETTAQMRASSPAWLADELSRSWRAQWPGLPDAMDEAARFVAPTRAEIGRLTAPLGVVAAVDDPIHPADVGRQWVSDAPCAALRTVTLDQIGADPSAMGAACIAALQAAV